ncbi:MAG: L,D-transpeptidase family protein [Kiritimatiellia bacterium]
MGLTHSRTPPRLAAAALLVGIGAALALTGCRRTPSEEPGDMNHNAPPTPAPAAAQPPAAPNPVPPPPARRFTLPRADAQKAFADARRRGLPADGLLVVADIRSQRLHVIDADDVACEYVMSSSKFGTGNKINSNQTPLGWHRINERIGGDQIHGRSFTSRRPDPVVLEPSQWRSDGGKDYVLTRILWLEGLEPGVNAGGAVDTHARCIYIHGTNQEHLLGQPSSHGCLRLSNRDVMELYDTVERRETYCLIR